TFGLLFVVAYASTPWSVVLFVVPLAALHWASRGYAAVLADRARLAGMHRATTSLATPVDPHDALPRFLAEVRACFESQAAELVLAEDTGRVVHHVRIPPSGR